MDSESKASQSDESSSSLMLTLVGLIQRFLNDIWKSPINLILSIVILYLLIKLVMLKLRSRPSSSQQKRFHVSLPKMSKCDLTVDELRGYNGIESNGRILTAVHGDIFDVSQRGDLYGIGELCERSEKCFAN